MPTRAELLQAMNVVTDHTIKTMESGEFVDELVFRNCTLYFDRFFP